MNEEEKEALADRLWEVLTQINSNEYLKIEDDNGDILLLLKGDGRIAGNFHLQSLSHIDDIVSSNISEEEWPMEDRFNSSKVDVEKEDIEEAFPDHLSFRLGPHKAKIYKKFNNKQLSFDQLFDLMSGPKRDGRYFGTPHQTKNVTLKKDVPIDILVEKQNGYSWERRLLGKKGDTIKATRPATYALYSHDGHTGMFYLSDDEYEEKPSLLQSIQGKLQNKRAQNAKEKTDVNSSMKP